MRTAVVVALSMVGLFFSFSAALGIVRMPDVYTRIQCASKATTLGALPVLLALVVAKGPISVFGSRSLIVAALILVLGPAAAHALARAAYRTGVAMWPGSRRDEPRAAEPDRPRDPS